MRLDAFNDRLDSMTQSVQELQNADTTRSRMAASLVRRGIYYTAATAGHPQLMKIFTNFYKFVLNFTLKQPQ